MKSVQSKPPLPTQTLMVNVRTRLSAAEGRGLTDTGGSWEMKSGSAETGPAVECPRVVITACVRAQEEHNRHSAGHRQNLVTSQQRNLKILQQRNIATTKPRNITTTKLCNNETSKPGDAKQRIKRVKKQLWARSKRGLNQDKSVTDSGKKKKKGLKQN